MNLNNLDQATLARLNKCKTKEEVQEITRELDLSLSDEELNEVTGGSFNNFNNGANKKELIEVIRFRPK